MRIGIIGAGVMGRVYARTVTDGDLRWRAEVVAVCDRDRALAAELAGHCRARDFDDAERMLREVELDAVYLAVPDHLHCAPFLACMAARVPTLVEKPLATTMVDAERMRAAAREAGVPVQVNFSNRANPVFVRMRQAIAAGDIGDVVGVNARLSNIVDYPTRMLSWAGSTTCGWFLLSHVFDLAAWLTGARAAEVTANGVKGRLTGEGIDTYDIIQALVRYDRGFAGLYESAWVLPNSLPSPVDFKVEVVGSHGALYADTQDQMVHVANDKAYTWPGTLDWTQARLSDFLDLVAGGDAPADALDDALENSALLLALHRAVADGGTVAVADVLARTAAGATATTDGASR